MESDFQKSKSALKRLRKRAAREERQQKLLQTANARQSLPLPAGRLLAGARVGTVLPCGHPRGHQWRCPICDRLNDLEREVCRECKFERPARAVRQHKALPKPDKPPTVRQPRLATDSGKPSWKDVVSAARQAGASTEMVQALEKEAAAARSASQERRLTTGDRLNQAEAKLRLAKKAATTAQQRVATLRTQLEEAEQRAATAAEEVASAAEDVDNVRSTLTAAPPAKQNTLLDSVVSLLTVLHEFNPPEAVVSEAHALQVTVDAALAAEPEPALDARVGRPLSTETRRRFGWRPPLQADEDDADVDRDSELTWTCQSSNAGWQPLSSSTWKRWSGYSLGQPMC